MSYTNVSYVKLAVALGVGIGLLAPLFDTAAAFAEAVCRALYYIWFLAPDAVFVPQA